jgi:hypothetical protein
MRIEGKGDPLTPLVRTRLMTVARFQRQHAELMSLAADIRAMLDVETIERDPRAVRVMLAQFAGKLRVHERMESEALYPALLEDERPLVRETAERLKRDLGPIYATFNAFEARYATVESLGVNPTAFIADTLVLFETLFRRMQRENKELYPLVAD